MKMLGALVNSIAQEQCQLRSKDRGIAASKTIQLQKIPGFAENRAPTHWRRKDHRRVRTDPHFHLIGDSMLVYQSN